MDDWYANPLWWVLIVTLGTTVAGFIFWFGRWKGQVDSDRDLFRKFTEDIGEKIDGIHEKIYGIQEKIYGIQEKIYGIQEKIYGIQKDVQQIFDRLPPAPTATGESPLRLTELGRTISAQLDADAIADGLVPELRERVAGLTPYEIQKECFAYVEDTYKPPRDIEVLIHKCAFDNGIDRAQVMRVVGIKLRDRLLPGEAAAGAA